MQEEYIKTLQPRSQIVLVKQLSGLKEYMDRRLSSRGWSKPLKAKFCSCIPTWSIKSASRGASNCNRNLEDDNDIYTSIFRA